MAIFAKLPILNVSYVFLVGMAAYAIIASSLLEMMAELLMPLLRNRWSQSLAQETIGHLRILIVPRVETLLVIASFIALAAAGTIYKLSAPSQIQEYSLDKWTLELKRHRLTYQSLILIRPGLCLTSSLLTLGAFLVLGGLTIIKFVQALCAFAGAAGTYHHPRGPRLKLGPLRFSPPRGRSCGQLSAHCRRSSYADTVDDADEAKRQPHDIFQGRGYAVSVRWPISGHVIIQFSASVATGIDIALGWKLASRTSLSARVSLAAPACCTKGYS